MNRYPPADATTEAIGLDLPLASPEQMVPNPISRKTVANFWFGTGRNCHKRRWGSNNLCTTSDDWLPGMFIGDTVHFFDACLGIIPGRSAFVPEGPPIPGSEPWGTTVLALVDGQQRGYKTYVTKGPMPQIAIDVLLVVRIKRKLWVKILKRGTDSKTVDNPGVLMSGAGEHCEPGTGSLKDQAYDAIAQETGLHPDDCVKSSFHIIGQFNSPGRDPRYWKFDAIDEDTGACVQFGYERSSTTTLNLIFIDYGDAEGGPKKTEPTDGIEVAQTFWMGLDDAIALDPNEFFLRENHQYLELVRDYIGSNGL